LSGSPDPRVLIIEDDPFLGPSLRDYLKERGFEAFWLGDERLWRETLSRPWEAVVLDLILPHIPGEHILRELKSRHPSLPVLILTAKEDLESKKVCFESGADDYLVKPFEVLELELRLRALLRRRERPPASREEIGELIVDLEAGVLRRGDEEVVLSRRAWDLLLYLLRNRGRIVSKEEILENVWSDVIVNEETLRSYIKELRRVLPREAIKTFKGRGYRLD